MNLYILDSLTRFSDGFHKGSIMKFLFVCSIRRIKILNHCIHYCVCAISLNLYFWILPLAVMGYSSTKSTCRGIL